MSQLDLVRRELHALVVELLLDEPLSKRSPIAEPEFKKIVVGQVLLEEVKGLPVEPIRIHHIFELLSDLVVTALNNLQRIFFLHIFIIGRMICC